MVVMQNNTVKKARKEREDKAAPGMKMNLHLTVKLRPLSRITLAKQASAAGFKSAAAYLRYLATQDRKRLGLHEYDYNAVPKASPSA